MKKTIITIIVLIIIVFLGYFAFFRGPAPLPTPVTTDTTNQTVSTTTTTTTQPAIPTNGATTVIGKSVGNRDILAYHFGTGSKEVLFVGGIHGGYEWNTALVAYQLVNYLKANPSTIPANVRVTVIPVLNPDGLNKVVGTTTGNFSASDVSKNSTTVVAGRFNGDKVDLNRNFDCDWQAKGTWQNTPVSGGSSAFSEPESQAIQSYVQSDKPTAVVVWYSSAGGVYASNCHAGILPDSDALTKAFASASGYSANDSFDFYVTTGDMTNWLAKIGTPAISVLLTNHTDTEWTKNLAGVQAVLNYYK